jgi:hypothetical protein
MDEMIGNLAPPSNTYKKKDYALIQNAQVGVVHPTHLSKVRRGAWAAGR